MRKLTNNLFKRFYQLRYRRIEQMVERPLDLQREILNNLLQRGRQTEYGKKFGLQDARSARDFSKALPAVNYDQLKPCIERMMRGERDILWPGRVHTFSKSSGTTSDKSKFIPVSKENFRSCHIRGGWDTMTLLYHHKEDCHIFGGKNFLMSGNHHPYPDNSDTIYGDVSALMIRNMPIVARPFFEPDFDIIFRDDWESKIELMAEVAIRKDVAPDITMIGGVPTWVIVFFRHILELSGKSHMLEVWPNFEAYLHGGVSLDPYREQLKQFLPGDQVTYFEVYNASEGYFATQYQLGEKDMLLLTDNGVYYEFLPPEEWDKEHPQAIPLEDVEVGKNYALLISSNAGLWRYKIGDTVTFTSTDPYLIRITGRVQQFINVFGEEVMVSNTDKAIAETCATTGAVVSEYTVAPVFIQTDQKGGHEWLIEFERPPVDLEHFNNLLDQNLQRINSDYEAKRYKDMALERLLLHPVPNGTFHHWLRSKGKFGNQHKVPRLSNNRRHLEEILELAGQD